MDGVQHAQAGALTGVQSCTDDDQSPRIDQAARHEMGRGVVHWIDQAGTPHFDVQPAGGAK